MNYEAIAKAWALTAQQLAAENAQLRAELALLRAERDAAKTAEVPAAPTEPSR
jgi:hypothetical protein